MATSLMGPLLPFSSVSNLALGSLEYAEKQNSSIAKTTDLFLNQLQKKETKTLVTFCKSLRWEIILENPEYPVTISGIFELNLDERADQEEGGFGFLRDPGREINWPLGHNHEYDQIESLKNCLLSSSLLGPDITLQALVEAVYARDSFMIEAYSIDPSDSQVQRAIFNELDMIYRNSYFADIVADQIIDIIKSLDTSSLDFKLYFTLDTLEDLIKSSLQFNNQKKQMVNKSLFADLIKIDRHMQSTRVPFVRQCVQQTLMECEGNISILPDLLLPKLSPDKFPKAPHFDGSSLMALRIPQDVLNAPEFPSAMHEFLEDSWKMDEEKQLTLTDITEEQWPYVFSGLKALIESEDFIIFMYAWKGLGF
jgi:hypothetical protein